MIFYTIYEQILLFVFCYTILFCFRIDLSDCELTSLLVFEKEISLNGTTYRKENITFMYVIIKCEMHDLVYSVKESKLFFNQKRLLAFKI